MDNLTIRDLLVQLLTQHENRKQSHIDRIFITLRERTGASLGDDIDSWVKWYFENSNDEDASVIQSLYKLNNLRKEMDDFEKQ